MRTSSSADVGICGVSLWHKTDAIWFYRAVNDKKREKASGIWRMKRANEWIRKETKKYNC